MGGWARGNLTAGSIIGWSIVQEHTAGKSESEEKFMCILKPGVEIKMQFVDHDVQPCIHYFNKTS